MSLVVYHVRGLVLTLVGAILIVGMAIVDIVVPHVMAVVGQVGEINPSSPTFVGTVGLVVGFITAFGGIIIQVCDRLNARRRADQEYRVRYYLVRKNYNEIAKYARDSYKYVMEMRSLCDSAGVRLPFELGPPPIPTGRSPGDSDDYSDPNSTPPPPPKS